MGLKRVYDWCGSLVHTPYAPVFLAFLFFIEAIFFIPVDPLLIIYCLEQPHRAWRYALIATGASVLGGLVAYGIGAYLWHAWGVVLVHHLGCTYSFERLCVWYKHYEWLTVLIAGFTPIPYKIVTLSAGFCRLPLAPFIICSLIARGARFFLVAGAVNRYGIRIKQGIDQYFTHLVLLFIMLILGTSIISLR